MYASLTPSPHSLNAQSIGKITLQYAVNVPQAAITPPPVIIPPPPPPPVPNAHVEILEQPASVGVRFRYKCEGRSAGCIRGISSSEKLKTYPTIKVCGYQGNANCVVSCVTKEGPPYYPHPHNLVGKQSSGHGVCFKNINTPDMICSFPNLGIQCVRKKDIGESLLQRQQLRVDPFGTGFSHSNQVNKINLNAVRLCFQVIISDHTGKICIPLPPVISEPICDNKTVSDLNIIKLSHASTPVTGGQQMILLCDQVNKDDIEILFYEEKLGNVVWSAQGKFSPQNVHRKVAIVVVAPSYKSMNISESVEVSIQLRRPSDGAMGNSIQFTYLPLKYDPEGMLRKVQKCDNVRFDRFLQSIGNEEEASGRIIKKAVRGKTKPPSEQLFQSKYVGSNSYANQNVPCNPNGIYGAKNFIVLPVPHAAASSTGNNFGSLPPAGQYSYNNLSPSPSMNKKEDILAIAAEAIHGSNDSATKQTEKSTDDTLERLASLDLGFDSSDMDMNINEFNFDSFPDPSALNI